MKIHLRLLNRYITKIAIFFKYILFINILFISSAYPISNSYEYNFIKTRKNVIQNDAFLMQKAFEAEMLAEKRDYILAAKIYYDISLKSKDEKIAKRATELAGHASDFELMLKSSDRWYEIAENKTPVMYVRVSLFITLGKIDLAINESLLIIKDSKDQDRFALVYDALKIFDDEIIKEIFEKIYIEYKDEYYLNFYYAQVLLDNNENEEAIKVIKNAHKFKEFSKTDIRWGIFLAEAYHADGEGQLSIDTLKDYLVYSPKDLNLNEFYAKILTYQKKYIEVIDHYKFMYSNKLINFNDINVAKKMALLNIEAKKFNNAKNFLDFIKKKEINSYNYLNGILHAKKNNIQKAEFYLKKVEIGDENYANSLHEIANIKIAEGQVDALKKFFIIEQDKVKNNKKIEVMLLLIESEIFFKEKNYEHCFSILSSGLEKHEDNTDLLYTRALVAEKIKKLAIFEDDLKKLIAINPEDSLALNALGYTFADNNIRLSEASKYIDKALLISPKNGLILDSKGWLLYKKEKYEEAEKYFIKALKYSQDSEIVEHYIKTLLKLKNITKAKKIHERYLKTNPTDEKLIKLIKVLNEI